jgi:hypothetical protein
VVVVCVAVAVAGAAIIVIVISGGGCDDDDAFHENWIQLGPDNVDCTPCISVVSDHAVCGFSSIYKLYNDYVGGESMGKMNRGEEHDLEPLPSFTEMHASFETVKSFLYMCSISEPDEQNILSLELLLCWWKCKASTKHLSVTDFFRKKVICMQVLM